jgi:hypothetical protein
MPYTWNFMLIFNPSKMLQNDSCAKKLHINEKVTEKWGFALFLMCATFSDV